ncbi:histidine phosphatase family protein [Facklamia sp. DSM 111018]|uniref:phosphoglycerate mutase (2,3-diphosphoglycerate-dependent) n=1 Tax=Facklamia lactis TaxID=2749967 RepID=A0ABS0LP40_9LACT|nr:histidine phosphatase family protein [Facklamia lactis]MBG9980116.1 histidine phosphatase family protein [Facklamia lactis]MBG9985918.1 histidine phosphatase family protein [Facklamia lactis]
MKLLLARHGQTQMNQESRFYGSLDCPINQTGKDQMKELAEKLRITQPSVDIILSSSLNRCVESAEIIMENTHYPSVKVKKVEGLSEIDFGKWEGLTANEIEQKSPTLWKEYIENPFAFCFPEGETFLSFKDRVLLAIDSTLTSISNQSTVLLMCHLGVLRLIKDYYDPMIGKSFWDYKFPQGDYVEITLDINDFNSKG